MNQFSGVSKDAVSVALSAINDMKPDDSVVRALSACKFSKPVTVFSIGKAAWRMARAAYMCLGAERVKGGIVITKYGHSEGEIGALEIFEAAHPVPDINCVRATERAIEMARNLTGGDSALLLISGGGSALFECPADGVSLDDIAKVTSDLLRSGADITDINRVRKRLSKVKGGRFAELLAPADITGVVLSDVLGDSPDVIASGPVHPDKSTCAEALAACEKYHIALSDAVRRALNTETPKALDRVSTFIAGNVEMLCESAARHASEIGYAPVVVNTRMSCDVNLAVSEIAGCLKRAQPKTAYIFGGEITVSVTGDGLGGRNQQLALACAEYIADRDDVCVIAVGSDGTDGPTDAAGGVVSGGFVKTAGIDEIRRHLVNNDAYRILEKHSALIKTGATGTNVNDLYMLFVN